MNRAALSQLLCQPEVEAVRTLARAPTILVGGAVRDALLGRAMPHDLDFAVQGNAISLGPMRSKATSTSWMLRAAPRACSCQRGPTALPWSWISLSAVARIGAATP